MIKKDDYVWIKLSKQFFNLENDIYICCTYIPPVNSSFYQNRNVNMLSCFEQDVHKLSPKGQLMMIGDVNARTKDTHDFIEHDMNTGDNDILYDIDEVNIRRSQDKVKVCTRGNDLLEICKSARLRILNGRTIGDSIGCYTCHKHNGSSVVDYVITNEDNLHNITYFQVLDFYGEVSDHCPISVGMKANYMLRPVNNYCNSKFPCRYIWNDDSIQKYQNAMVCKEVKERINNLHEYSLCNSYNANDMDELVKKLSAVYITAAEKSLKKIRYISKTQQSNKKKWFDKSLSVLKKEVNFLANQLKKFPNVTEIRGVFFRTLKIYNKERRLKSRKFKNEMVEKLDELKENNPKGYWQLLKTLKDEKLEDSRNIPIDDWKDYFSDLCDVKNKKNGNVLEEQHIIKELQNTRNDKYFDELSISITEKEVIKAIKLLKKNKSVGIDLISNEMLKYSQHIMLPYLVKVFNSILLAKHYPKEWCDSYITPLHKSGSKIVESNYRGISIFSCLGKLFNTILNNRLENYIEEKNLISDKQIGFKRKCRTSDHMFILRTLVEKYTKNGQKLYACFVDFRKAFDYVNHKYLLFKLYKNGIRGNFYQVIYSMYINRGFKSCVKSNNMISSHFNCKTGVRQGDPLSPNLFKLFINDVQDFINLGTEAPSLHDLYIDHLLYADDIVLLAKNEKDLQTSISGLERYCKKWGMLVNIDKTKIVVFNRGGKIVNTNIVYENTIINSVDSYKYLGVKFHVTGKFEVAKKDLLDRSLKRCSK